MLFLHSLFVLLFGFVYFNNTLAMLVHELEVYRVVLVMEAFEVLLLLLELGWLGFPLYLRDVSLGSAWLVWLVVLLIGFSG